MSIWYLRVILLCDLAVIRLVDHHDLTLVDAHCMLILGIITSKSISNLILRIILVVLAGVCSIRVILDFVIFIGGYYFLLLRLFFIP